jgi:hypothetical protein
MTCNSASYSQSFYIVLIIDDAKAAWDLVRLETIQILMFSNVKVNIHKCKITTLWFKLMRGQAAASTCKYNLNKETNTQQVSDHTDSWVEAPPTGEVAAM